MKIIYTLLFLLITSPLYAQQYYQVGIDILNVRSSASKTSEVIARLSLGDSIYVTEYSNEWSKVKLEDGNYGYIASKYISSDFIKYSSDKTTQETKNPLAALAVTILVIVFSYYQFIGKSKNSTSKPKELQANGK